MTRSTDNRRLTLSVFAATILLGVATVGLAAVPPRPLRSAVAVVHALSFGVAADWLVVVALLAVGERYARAGKTVDRRTVARFAAVVFVGGFAIEASALLQVVLDPASADADRFARGLVAAVQRALFPTGLFVATAVGTGRVSDRLHGRTARATSGGLPLAPTGRWARRVASTALGRVVAVLAVAGVLSMAVDAVVRVALGVPHVWLAVADAALAALAGVVGHAVLAAAFVVLVTGGVNVRTLVGGTALVWVALFVSGVAVAVLSGLVGVGLVSVTTTPMGAVEAAALGQWPRPDSWAILLDVGTFLAGAVGLFAVQRTTGGRSRSTDPGAANDPQDA